MFKKITALFFLMFFTLHLCGCVALLAGAAGGAGTAAWLSGKLSQEFNVPYARAVVAAESALKSLNLKITKETREAEVTQLRSEYTDGKDIWVDVRKVSEQASKVEVRVGAISADKEAAAKIMQRIDRYI